MPLSSSSSSPTSPPSSILHVNVDELSSNNLRWSHVTPMKMQREGGAAVAVGAEMVVVVGGYHAEHKFLNSAIAFHAGQWKNLPNMTDSRMGCGACSIVTAGGHNRTNNNNNTKKKLVIVAGGFQKGRTYLNTVEMLDLVQLKQWKSLPPMRYSRAGCAAVGLFSPASSSNGGSEGDGEDGGGGDGGVVIVCGGWKNADTAMDTVEQLDLATGQWSLLPNMLTARAGCAAVVVDNTKIVVAGGYSNYGYCLSTAEVFDTTTQTWSSLPSMKERRDASAACVVGRLVMVVGGGESSTRPSRTCEILNMDKLSEGWKTFPHLQSPRFGCAMAAMGNQILVLGGRGPDGQHLECVETVTLPLIAKPKQPKAHKAASHLQRARSKSDVGITRSSEKSDTKTPAGTNSDPSSEEWKRMVESTIKMANHMMAKDRARTNMTYERAKQHEVDECADKIKEVDKKLKALESEKARLERARGKALRHRDERLIDIEEQRQQSLAQIEKQFRPLISKAANSSAPEYFTGDAPSMSPSVSASELALTLKDEPEEPPEELICSITGMLMKDPVTAVDGHTYEREAIELWFRRFKTGKPTSPMTNQKLNSRRLVPSHNIRSQCRTWLKRTEEAKSCGAKGTHGRGGGDRDLDVQSCVEPRRDRSRASSSSRHQRSSSSSATARSRRHHRHHQSDSNLLRSSSASRSGRSSASRGGRSSTSISSRIGRLDTEPPSPLGRSFTLFRRSGNASGLASTRRPSQ